VTPPRTPLVHEHPEAEHPDPVGQASGATSGDGGAPVGAERDVVEMISWPADEDRRQELATWGFPRLLLVEAGTPPPRCVDPLEDWVRVPVDGVEAAARIESLRARLVAAVPEAPVIDTDGVVRFGGAWVALPPVEGRIMSALVARFGSVVRRADLVAAGWPDGAPGRNALDVHVLRLRRRLKPLGLAIRTIRSRGYLLEPVDLAETKHSRHRAVRDT
jgi:hypothetical protein